MKPHVQTRIEDLHTAFRHYGYAIAAEPISGEEETFVQALEAGLHKLQDVFERNARRYRYRGRSKNALAALHKDLPSPSWGVETIAP